LLIGDIPRRNAKLYPGKTAVEEGERSLTFAQLNERVNRLANVFLSLRADPADKIAVLNHNCLEYIELYFAAAKAGMPIVPLNFRYAKDELSYVINDSKAALLFFGGKYLPVIQEVKKEVGCIKHLVCIDKHLPGIQNYEEMLALASSADPLISLDENDLAILGYTGGTTGLPKGVMSTHRNVLASSFNTAIGRRLGPGGVFLNAPPLFHAGDANSMFAFSLAGCTNVVMNFFSPEDILRQIQDHRITHALVVPAMILFMLQFPGFHKFDLRSLQVLYYGTAPMPLEPLKEAMSKFRCGFSQTYGATETFVTISILQPEDHVLEGAAEDFKRMSSAGREVAGVQVKIVDESGSEVKQGQVGEITVKGHNVMKGYWNQPEMTAQVLKNGWYYTGDMGRMDELAYIYIVDRKKDLIVSGGENIYPKEVENVLFTHPAVAEAAVFGVPDDTWGEAVKAVVVKKQGHEVSGQELIEFCRQRLASYKKPKDVEFAQELPRSSAGKVLKRELRDRYWKDRQRKV
jgi:long-chain acyl-CoA synthetase